MKRWISPRNFFRSDVRFSLLLKTLFVQTFALTFALIGTAEASSISLKGRAKITTSIEGENLVLVIDYSLYNKGDEKAYFIEPHFQLGSWSLRVEKKHIPSNRSANWKIAATVPLSSLSCPEGPRCVELELPLKGTHPLLVSNTYQDKSEKNFSAVEVWNIAIGEIDPKILADLKKPPLVAHFDANRDPDYFKGVIKIENNSSEKLKFAVTYFLPNEFKATSKNDTLTIAPGSEGNYRFHYENKGALRGSSYATYALLQANYKGVRMSVPLATQTVLLPAPKLHKGILFTLISLVLGLLAVVLYVFRENESYAS
jgi:hypothetical protein